MTEPGQPSGWSDRIENLCGTASRLAQPGVELRAAAALGSRCSPRPLSAGVIRTDVRLAVAEQEAENSAMSTVSKEIQSLSVPDRLRLLEEIWDSLIETPEAVPVTDAQRKELARRRRAHARNPSAAKSWAQVRARLRRCK